MVNPVEGASQETTINVRNMGFVMVWESKYLPLLGGNTEYGRFSLFNPIH